MKSPEAHRFDHKFNRLKGTVFIVTYGRSGSTLLQNLLMTIPGCVIRGENHNMMEPIWQAAMRCRMTRGTWGQEHRPPTHPWHGADGIRPWPFAASMIDGFVDHVLCPPPGARWFGFKEIRYNALGGHFAEMLDFMAAHFKNAHFVFNTRRIEDVMKSAWWTEWKPDEITALVRDMDRRFADYHDAHPGRTRITRYEEFATDPGALREVFDMLEEPMDRDRIQAVLRHRLSH